MNKLQSDLATVIWALITCPGFVEKVQDSAVRYGYLNYIAKYSLASDGYLITNKAYKHIQKLNLIKESGLRRGSKSRARQFTYEHPIPSNVVADEILVNGTTKARMLKILGKSDCVTVLTQANVFKRSWQQSGGWVRNPVHSCLAFLGSSNILCPLYWVQP